MENGRGEGDDCNLLQDGLPLFLDRLYTVTDCVKTLTFEIEGF